MFGTASLYFFKEGALLLLVWYLLILVYDLYGRYGISSRPMASSPVAGAPSPTSAAPELMLPLLETSSWPERARKYGETRAAWQTLEVPQELHDVPQDENFPQEVLNIIKWSLMRENKGKDTTLASELPAGDLADLVPEINREHAPQLETSSKPVETQRCESVKDQRSSSKDGKREKLRNLLNIKSSITDLSSEVKDSLTRVRNVKAAREAREKESSCTVECTGCFVSPHTPRYQYTFRTAI